MVICLERGADLHMAQYWFFPFLYRLTWVVPDNGPLNVCNSSNFDLIKTKRILMLGVAWELLGL